MAAYSFPASFCPDITSSERPVPNSISSVAFPICTPSHPFACFVSLVSINFAIVLFLFIIFLPLLELGTISVGEQILSHTGEVYERMFSYHQSARGYFHVPISENWREILWSDWLVKNILIYISSLPPENRHHLVLGFDKCLSAKICMNKVR